MKQHITDEQLKELTKKGKARLQQYWLDTSVKKGIIRKDQVQEVGKFFSVPHEWVTIGQMIQFLDEAPEREDGYNPWEWFVEKGIPSPKLLCDSLWEAVKEVLTL